LDTGKKKNLTLEKEDLFNDSMKFVDNNIILEERDAIRNLGIGAILLGEAERLMRKEKNPDKDCSDTQMGGGLASKV